MTNSQIKYWVLQVIALVVTPILLTALGVDLLMVLAVEALVLLCFACLRNLGNNIFFFFFLVSFFVFLMSGDIAEAIFDKQYHLQFSEAATEHSRIAILVCLVSMYVGYLLCPAKKPRRVEKPKENKGDVSKIRLAAKLVFFCTYLILIINTIDMILFVSANGYVAYYLYYDPMLPSVIAEFGDFTPIALAVFLGTFPSKKECLLPMGLYFFYAAMSFLTGIRGAFIYITLFLVAYMIYRGHREKGQTVWISKKQILLLCLAVPFVMVFLYLYDFVRSGANIAYTTFGDTLVDFFVNIGSSSKVIKYGYDYRNSIEGLRWFSLGETLNYFEYGTLFNLFSSEVIPPRHSVQFALEAHSFDAFISYKAMQEQFLSGHGTGSSFVAELFADFGYVGVALGSLIYGFLFKRISTLGEDRWLGTAIKLHVFLSLVEAPRSNFDGFIAAIVNVNFVLIVVFIYVLSKMITTKGSRTPGKETPKFLHR